MATRRAQRLDRREAVKELLNERGELLVVTGLGAPSYDVYAAGDCAANMYLWGAMGGAAMFGLGLALAQPQRPVAVITGDGEALMGLGALATVAVKKPGNLSLIVLDNEEYGETGMQATHTRHGVDLRSVAIAVGFAWTADLANFDELAACRREIHALTGGPRLIVARIAPGNAPRALPPRDGVFLKNRFRAHLGFSVE
jgi:thiamine pyrophosphate-dependent acetolactate synthase large subunit-like protein